MSENRKETLHFTNPTSISVTSGDVAEVFPPHWHNAAEFTLILKDGCRYRINDTLYKLNTGDVLLIWPGQIHETVKIPKKSAQFIQFSSVILENNMDLLSVSRFLYEFHYISHEEEPELADFIRDRFMEIEKLYNSFDTFAETKCKAHVYAILLQVAEHVMAKNRDTEENDDTSKAGWQYIRSACNYISENYANDITQTEVADHIGISSFYFSKLFKQYMHVSFPAYLTSLRVKRAANLLLDKNIPITECAFMAGFQSTTTFNKVFKELTGYSPREYRKLYR